MLCGAGATYTKVWVAGNTSLWLSDVGKLALKRKYCNLKFGVLLLKMFIYICIILSLTIQCIS